MQCKQKSECPDFKEKESKLETLTPFSAEWLDLVDLVEALKCNGENDWICCKTEKIKGGFDNVKSCWDEILISVYCYWCEI